MGKAASTAIFVFMVALSLCGEAQAEDPQQTKQAGRWSWELGWGLVGETHDAQGLLRREDEPGNPVLQFGLDPVLQAACGWEGKTGVFALRGGIDTAKFSIDDVFGFYTSVPEPSFSGSFRVAEGRWTAIRLEALWLVESSNHKWGSLFAGASWNHIGSIRVTPVATEAYELTSVSSTDRLTGLFGADWFWRLGSSRWAFGFNSTWNIGAGAEVRFETDPTSPYNSGVVNFRPWSASIRLSRVQ
jgi:hypothetical protein